MELRTLLYGYNKHQFRFLINETESAVVKGIFDEYIGGGTLQKIADRLTAENTVYYKDKTVWNKHTVGYYSTAFIIPHNCEKTKRQSLNDYRLSPFLTACAKPIAESLNISYDIYI